MQPRKPHLVIPLDALDNQESLVDIIGSQELAAHVARYVWRLRGGFETEIVAALHSYSDVLRMYRTSCSAGIQPPYSIIEIEKIKIADLLLEHLGYETMPVFEHDKNEQVNGYKKIPIPEALRWEVFKRDEFKCVRCGRQDHLRADHIIPESKGGEATLENLQTLCRNCNSKKGTK